MQVNFLNLKRQSICLDVDEKETVGDIKNNLIKVYKERGTTGYTDALNLIVAGFCFKDDGLFQ